MARTSSCLLAGLLGMTLAGLMVSPASAATLQPARGTGADACPAPAAWLAVPSWSGSWMAVPAGTVDPGVSFTPTGDGDGDPLVPEHELGRCDAPRMSDPAPGLDDGLGSLLWRGPDWGVPSLGTFV